MQTLSKKLRDQTNQIMGKARMYKQERKCKYEERGQKKVWGKQEEEMKKRKCFMKGGANMVEDEEWFRREGCNYLKWKINGGAVMQNVNTLLKHVAMEKGI